MASRTHTGGLDAWPYIIGLYPVFTLLWGLLLGGSVAVAALTSYSAAQTVIFILLGLSLLVLGLLHIFIPVVIIAILIDFYHLRVTELWNLDRWHLLLLVPHLLFAIWPVLHAGRTDLTESAYFGRAEWAVLVISAIVTVGYLYRRYQHVGVPIFGSQSTKS